MLALNSSITHSNGDRILVRSCGRVHFGLLEICESEPNCFGGIGLMVEQSVAMVQAAVKSSGTSHCEVIADSHWKPRIEAVTQQWLLSHPSLPIESIEAVQSPMPHQGLGSGTQMACTVATLLLAASTDYCDKVERESAGQSLQRLATLSMRGKRSNIGLCGFLQGGLVVDHGKNRDVTESPTSLPRTERFEFPDWPVIVMQDNQLMGDSGDDEVALFEECRHRPNPHRESMIQMIHQEILPAMRDLDWARWNKALGQYGRWAGQIFKPVQGGVYRTPKIANTIEIANRLGLTGATQSSWGPTVCAFALDAEHALWCCARLQEALSDINIVVTKAANQPAQVSRL